MTFVKNACCPALTKIRICQLILIKLPNIIVHKNILSLFCLLRTDRWAEICEESNKHLEVKYISTIITRRFYAGVAQAV
jgi:hypothetical protein